MNNYVQPIILDNEELAEGVYATGSGQDCYSVTGYIHQIPQTGRGDYRIQFDGTHSACDGHHSTEQVLVIQFNQIVTYKSSQGELVGGNGTATVSIKYHYHNNAFENIGLGDVIVESNPGLVLQGCYLTCNHVNDH